MLRKYGTRINPATFGFVIEKEDFDNHGAGYESDKFFPDDVEEKDSKTQLGFSLRMKMYVKLLSVAAEYTPPRNVWCVWVCMV